MTICWAWWVRRSRAAEASSGFWKRSGHSASARLEVTINEPRSYRSLMTS